MSIKKKYSPSKNRYVIALFFFLALTNLSAQLSGVVVNWQQQPVSDCQVSLALATGSDITVNGAFQITATNLHALPKNFFSNKKAFYSGSHLYFNTSANVQIHVYGVSGGLLGQMNYSKLNDGQYKIHLSSIIPEYSLRTPVYVKITTEHYTSTVKIIHSPKNDVGAEPIRVSNQEYALHKQSAAADSLIIDCPGPHDKKVPIVNYIGNLGNIELDKPPHIVFVLTDDQGYGELGAHGNAIIQTPNLDAFWAKSTRFTNYHVAPTCSPTRTQLLSGRHEFRYGVTHTIYGRERMAPTAHTIADVLTEAGYKTGVFGKWHVGDENEYVPNRRGFQEAVVHKSGAIWAGYTDPPLWHNNVQKPYIGYSADIFFREAIAWMKANKDTPMFTYIASNTPHSPCLVDAKYSNLYSNLYGQPPPLDGESYYGMVTNIDDNFGWLMDSLKAFGMEENTVVIFMTDNGHSIQGPGGVGHNGDGTLKADGLYNAGMRGGKHQPWNGGARVPNFWYWPGKFQQGIDIDGLTAGFDTYPTLAEIAGATIPDSVILDGLSYYPLLENPSTPWADRYIVQHEGRWQQGEAANSQYRYMSIRNSKYSWVMNNSLYDMIADPGETTNVINQHPDVVADMRAWYDQWWAETLPLMVNEQ